MIGDTGRLRISAGAVTCAMALEGCQSVPSPPPQFVELAAEAAQLALSTCREAGFATTVPVTDANGGSVAILSADGANPRKRQIAPTKTAMVRKYGVPSSHIATRVESDAGLAADIVGWKSELPGASRSRSSSMERRLRSFPSQVRLPAPRTNYAPNLLCGWFQRKSLPRPSKCDSWSASRPAMSKRRA
jgi:hypothetical protein